jgi:hypothetical protein
VGDGRWYDLPQLTGDYVRVAQHYAKLHKRSDTHDERYDHAHDAFGVSVSAGAPGQAPGTWYWIAISEGQDQGATSVSLSRPLERP